ncbi:hypothetical protein CYY_010053 [Polysphondylium violaceum]|uniref:MACPF domain-containing protein n=1 Tax=Polysphondylium violaceum TaxID=133409 RepID=A0A8J4PJF4_9MYCE|nr:hypothetical protein CYY_010053 [Polysphondylium violaceum]
MTNEKNTLVETSLLCTTSVLQLTDQYSFHPLFLESISNVKKVEDVVLIIERYGTHFMKRAIMGGKLTQVTSISEKEIKQKTSRTIINTYEDAAPYSPSDSGGQTNFPGWASTVDLLPVPVKNDLMTIRDIIPSKWTIFNDLNVLKLWMEAEEIYYQKYGFYGTNQPNTDLDFSVINTLMLKLQLILLQPK